MNVRYTETGSSFRIREIAGGYQFYILPDYVGYVEELFARRRKMRLTRAALETIAIIAYKQPVTKNEIEQIRGVSSDGVINTLLEKNMVLITGRATTVGKPLQYGTNEEFLKFFGLNSLADLPKMSEIEELLASNERREQTELGLPQTPFADAYASKLNVADGTYNPAERDADIESLPTGESQSTPQSGGRRITLHRTGENADFSAESESNEISDEQVDEIVPDLELDEKTHQ